MIDIQAIELGEYVSHISAAAITRPFVAADRDGKHWVVKTLNPEKNHLWRDYVGGNLAIWLGLPWPRPLVPAVISDDVRRTVRSELEFEPSVDFGLATPYIEGLSLPKYGLPPFGGFTSNDPFVSLTKDERLERVKRALSPLMCNENNLAALYGRFVFDSWLAERDPMMDMLQVAEEKRLVCLDASSALNCRRDVEDTFHSMAPYCIHYMLEGLQLYAKPFVTDCRLFTPWLSRLDQLTHEVWDSIVSACPFSPPHGIKALRAQTLDILGFKSRFLNLPLFSRDRGFRGES
ncbi:MAG TPA: hypothetical protein EYO33_22325 [Phycisphaerales bacterium]|nr:hypothetical protein [Phycisphaerales bacterium]